MVQPIVNVYLLFAPLVHTMSDYESDEHPRASRRGGRQRLDRSNFLCFGCRDEDACFFKTHRGIPVCKCCYNKFRMRDRPYESDKPFLKHHYAGLARKPDDVFSICSRLGGERRNEDQDEFREEWQATRFFFLFRGYYASIIAPEVIDMCLFGNDMSLFENCMFLFGNDKFLFMSNMFLFGFKMCLFMDDMYLFGENVSLMDCSMSIQQ